MAKAKARKVVRSRAGEYVLCPIFIANTKNEIQCQAHLPDSSSTVHKYSNEQMCRRQRTMFCEGCWERCEHYLSWRHFRWEEEE